MKYGVYALRDAASGTFTEPRLFQTDMAAVRDFRMMVNETGIQTIRFQPKDFDLYKIGEYDLETAMLSAVTPVIMLANGASLIGD